jgi:hypothetical protein
MSSKPTLPYQRSSRGAWLRVPVRGGHVVEQLPQVCCNCLATTISWWRFSGLSSVVLPLPICPACRRLWAVRQRLIFGTSFACLTSAVAALVWIMWSEPAVAFVAGTCVYVAGLMAIGFLYHFLGGPVVVSSLPRYGNDHVWIYFRNDAYLRSILDTDAGSER